MTHVDIAGKHNTAKIFTDNVEQTAISQIIELCNQEFTKDSKIRIMPDVHAGAGCVIGTTMTIQDKVVPNLVGVDIGCGMLTIQLPPAVLDLAKIDNFIRREIPHGFHNNRDKKFDFISEIDSLRCLDKLTKDARTFNLAVGSLGGGNHFIEIAESDEVYYLIVHSGSRNMGLQVAKHYQDLAVQYISSLDNKSYATPEGLITEYKNKGRHREISEALKELKKQWTSKPTSIKKALCYLTGGQMDDYLHDMEIAQEYASHNRRTMANRILDFIGVGEVDSFETIHNYIDMNDMMLRKGAVSAKKNEKLLVPMNMRDGSLLCRGEGNPEWNESAPHGAGRIMSRSEAKRTLDVSDFEETMQGIHTSSVGRETLDEAPMAYKPMKEIMDNTKETMVIEAILKPVYNFKAS